MSFIYWVLREPFSFFIRSLYLSFFFHSLHHSFLLARLQQWCFYQFINERSDMSRLYKTKEPTPKLDSILNLSAFFFTVTTIFIIDIFHKIFQHCPQSISTHILHSQHKHFQTRFISSHEKFILIYCSV